MSLSERDTFEDEDDSSTKELDFIRLARAHRELRRGRRPSRHAERARTSRLAWRVPLISVLAVLLVFGTGLALGRITNRRPFDGSPAPGPIAASPAALRRRPARSVVAHARGRIHETRERRPARSKSLAVRVGRPPVRQSPLHPLRKSAATIPVRRARPAVAPHPHPRVLDARRLEVPGRARPAPPRYRRVVASRPARRAPSRPPSRTAVPDAAGFDRGTGRVLDELARRTGN